MKKGLLGLAGLGGLALASKVAKAGGLVFNDGSTQSAGSLEGTSIKSTSETGGTKFLREDGDGTSSWQAAGGGAEDLIVHGFEVSIQDNASSATVGAGKLYHGSTKIDQTSDVTLTMGTAADWHDGVQDSYSGGEGWCYVGVDSSGNIKFLGDNPPDETDTLGNSAGKLIYWNNSGTYWFVVGAVRIDTADIAAFEIHSYGRWSGTRAANHSVLSSGSATSWTSIDLSSIVPANGVHVHGHLWVSRSDSGNYEFDVGDDGFELVSMRFNPKHSGANLRGVTQFNYPIRTSQTIYYIAGAAAMNCTMFIGAWEF